LEKRPETMAEIVVAESQTPDAEKPLAAGAHQQHNMRQINETF